MKKWLAIGALGVAVGVLTFYLRQERDDQPALAAETEQSSVNPAPIPAPIQPTNLAPSGPVSQEAPPLELPPKPSGNEFHAPLEHSSVWEAEVRDPIWAQAMEDGWRNFYSGNADLMKHGMPTIECKKSLCEARMRASSVNAEVLMELQGKSTQPLVIPVGTQLGGISVKVGDQQEGATEYLVSMSFYMRTTEQP